MTPSDDATDKRTPPSRLRALARGAFAALGVTGVIAVAPAAAAVEPATVEQSPVEVVPGAGAPDAVSSGW
ncbi:hypothetical protein DW322_18925 [Rhodococcus rhodnii]|uniref:Uncharacterized protein n=2 Tax=Rhodococcus rhodnii TaxID=38312 RepID=R7WJX2_9NOCA|nr:hypothetical protein [Rhodococcus rhodnii]EOM75602.1 hypothetical protein Rrhod_3062 [Rhodococcus rhodnii LMG 5362]TXG91877.1 hypothetical protein DW322_18925 [Rhodococcus rhodnii]